MLVSTFELLVKSQLPKNLPSPLPNNLEKLSRTVIQGYFLTLANTTSSTVKVSLVFTAVSPAIDIEKTFVFLDVEGVNIPGDLIPDTAPNKARFTITIPANDTGLFILQPDILKTGKDSKTLLDTADFELRGYVEIFMSSLSKSKSAKLLLTPEHRGTFFKNLKDADPQLDQIVYSLPTANGGSLFNLKNSNSED
ncbi:hypothetical protein [Coleofasciculus sp. FACHB-1120]|uniref:hypothetical protein n=1 Tax=Coleofasciculus sp. FACHB-1120 TaxID=2692783 RepID=UPI001683E6DC|nr:hypothetical protein [Coleofasciculus sp. FACHB-1120]MBD2741803.1 hypothetical protein [Coleofasciculus sp. FACHB-1120]